MSDGSETESAGQDLLDRKRFCAYRHTPLVTQLPAEYSQACEALGVDTGSLSVRAPLNFAYAICPTPFTG